MKLKFLFLALYLSIITAGAQTLSYINDSTFSISYNSPLAIPTYDSEAERSYEVWVGTKSPNYGLTVNANGIDYRIESARSVGNTNFYTVAGRFIKGDVLTVKQVIGTSASQYTTQIPNYPAGTTIHRPANMAALNALSLKAGDVVVLQAGVTYTNYTASVSGVTYVRGGSGYATFSGANSAYGIAFLVSNPNATVTDTARFVKNVTVIGIEAKNRVTNGDAFRVSRANRTSLFNIKASDANNGVLFWQHGNGLRVEGGEFTNNSNSHVGIYGAKEGNTGGIAAASVRNTIVSFCLFNGGGSNDSYTLHEFSERVGFAGPNHVLQYCLFNGTASESGVDVTSGYNVRIIGNLFINPTGRVVELGWSANIISQGTALLVNSNPIVISGNYIQKTGDYATDFIIAVRSPNVLIEKNIFETPIPAYTTSRGNGQSIISFYGGVNKDKADRVTVQFNTIVTTSTAKSPFIFQVMNIATREATGTVKISKNLIQTTSQTPYQFLSQSGATTYNYVANFATDSNAFYGTGANTNFVDISTNGGISYQSLAAFRANGKEARSSVLSTLAPFANTSAGPAKYKTTGLNVGAYAGNSTVVPPADITPPSTVGFITVISTSNTAQISWTGATDAGSGIKEYEVKRSGVVIAKTPTTVYTLSGLTPATSYTYAINAVDNAGNVGPATSTTFTTKMDSSGLIAEQAAQIKKLEAEVAELQNLNTSLSVELASVKQQLTTTQTQLSQANANVTRLTSDNAKLVSDLSALTTQYNALVRELSALLVKYPVRP